VIKIVEGWIVDIHTSFKLIRTKGAEMRRGAAEDRSQVLLTNTEQNPK
jgi:hypothetical protein